MRRNDGGVCGSVSGDVSGEVDGEMDGDEEAQRNNRTFINIMYVSSCTFSYLLEVENRCVYKMSEYRRYACMHYAYCTHVAIFALKNIYFIVVLILFYSQVHHHIFL